MSSPQGQDCDSNSPTTTFKEISDNKNPFNSSPQAVPPKEVMYTPAPKFVPDPPSPLIPGQNELFNKVQDKALKSRKSDIRRLELSGFVTSKLYPSDGLMLLLIFLFILCVGITAILYYVNAGPDMIKTLGAVSIVLLFSCIMQFVKG